MKAINYYIVIDKIKEAPKKVGGLELTEKQDSDVRYLKGTVISAGNLVEGIKDKLALENLGIKNKIITLTKKPLYQVVEESQQHKQIILLTDFDKEGKKLYTKLNSDLQQHGVQVDNKFREWLQSKTRIKCIENLKTTNQD